jgi:hypothetical protein
MFHQRHNSFRVKVTKSFSRLEEFMKNPTEVLQMKEEELVKVRKEIDALRVAARLLSDESVSTSDQKHDLRQLIEMP